MTMAASRLHGVESPSLAAGDLLHDALLKVMGGAVPDWQDRGHFFATLSLAMRSVLVDHARARQADKRGGACALVTYTLRGVGEESMAADLLTLDALLDQLQAAVQRRMRRTRRCGPTGCAAGAGRRRGEHRACARLAAQGSCGDVVDRLRTLNPRRGRKRTPPEPAGAGHQVRR